MRVLLIVVVLGLGACSSQSSYAGVEEINMGSEYRTCLHSPDCHLVGMHDHCLSDNWQ